MSNIDREGVRMHIADTLTHKQLFIQSAIKMIDYLYTIKDYESALELAKRASTHDHSKFDDDEIEQFIQLPKQVGASAPPNGILTDDQKLLIEVHWKKNRHHPEFFSDYHKMDKIDILEMCCDWHARSVQFKNDFMTYVLTVPKKRFGFDDEFFATVFSYCEVLNK